MPAGLKHSCPKEVDPARRSVWDWDKTLQSQNSAVNLASRDGFVESIRDVKCLRVSDSRRVAHKMALEPASRICVPVESTPCRQEICYEWLPVGFWILRE